MALADASMADPGGAGPRAAATTPLQLWLPLAALVAVAIALAVSDADLALSDAFYDRSRGSFPARGRWWVDGLLHRDAANLVAAVAVGAFACFAASWRVPRLARCRWAALQIALTIAVSCTVVAGLKLVTGRHCPIELDRYGGGMPYAPWFAPTAGSPPGRGFPGAHAAAGFSLLAGYFAARRLGARRPAWWLLPGVALGGLFSLVQVARGAHFLSHQAWSAAICWFIAYAIDAGLERLVDDRGRDRGRVPIRL
jgi:membrane-associated PAP2 superfamily phosphatase